MRDRLVLVDISTKRFKSVNYKQYDVNNLLQIVVMENNSIVNISNYVATAYFEMPSGNVYEINGTINNNTINVLLSNLVLSEYGRVMVEVELVNLDRIVTTFTFYLNIEKSIDKARISSNTNHTHLNKDVLDQITQGMIDSIGLSGGLVDLSDYALKSEIPTKTSQLTNDSNYLTSVPSEYVTETELNNKGYLTSEYINNYSNQYNVMNIEGVVGDGVNDDGSLISSFINTIENGSSLFFPSGKVFKGDINIINKKGITLHGFATIIGTLSFKYDSPTYTENSVNGLKIYAYNNRQSYTTVTKNCVLLENCRSINFSDCEFRFGLCGICISPINEKKHSGAMVINSCKFNYNNYDLYAVNDNYDDYLLMDTAISNCQSHSAQISSIHVKKADGLIISNNTFFMAGYTLNEPQKKNNIYIDSGNFINITGNNLFEAGEDAIFIKDFRNTNISNNNIAWSGQCKLSSGIYLKSSALSNSAIEALVRCTVSNNTIDNPSLYGINIEGYFQGLLVEGNSLLLNTGTYYYGNTLGNESYNSSNVKAIKVDNNYANKCSISIINNIYYANEDEIINSSGIKTINNFSKNGIVNRGYKQLILTDTQWGTSTLNYSNTNAFSDNDFLIIPSERTINLNLQCIGGSYDYKIIKIINNSTKEIKISHNSSGVPIPFYTKDGNTITMSQNSIREFMYLNSAWYEI